jgi:serine/threonine-protein kinase
VFVCPECGHASPSPGFCTEHGIELGHAADPLLGHTVGSYRIVRAVGQGGMGRVYLAVQPAIGSRVAVKVLSAECAERPELVERFFAEARAVNLIRHDNIVSVLDLSWLPDRRPFIVMEYLDGAPLSRVLERGPLPLEQALAVVTEMLDALAAAHARGIVHRDLKPDNVFITTSGRAKILDFGVAKLRPDVGSISAETRTGALVGTPHYMSPEQARGRPADHRSDLYAVGLILFEALTGRRAFDAESLFDLLRLQVEQPAPSLATLRPDLPRTLEAVLARALDKIPERRFQSAEELKSALAQAMPGLSWSSARVEAHRLAPLAPGAAPPKLATHPGVTHSLITAPPQPSGSGAFRWALLAVGTALAMLAIFAGVAVVWRVTRDDSGPAQPPPPPTLATAPDPTEPPPGTAVAASLAGTWDITSAANPGGAGSYRGTIAIAERATDLYTMDWNIPGSPAYRGFALRHKNVLGVAWGPGNDYGLVVYTVRGGRLEGRWALGIGNALGSEVLEGPSGLNGAYRIVSGKNPNGTAYGGKVEITPAGDFYRVSWNTPGTAYRGLGLLENDVFVVAWNPQRGTGVVAYRIEGERLVGRWTVPGVNGVGRETAVRR